MTPAKRKIVVLDDDLAFGRIVSRAAHGIGIETLATADPNVLRAEARGSGLAGIVLDLKMPGLDGVEMLRELASLGFEKPVVLASGVAGKVLETARNLGVEYGLRMAGALAKPVRVNELRELLSGFPEPAEELSGEALIAGVNAGEFTLHYQPKLDLRTDAICAFEALVRWRHPTMGMLAPELFIKIAESSGAIAHLTDWVLAEGIARLGAWRVSGLELGLALNISVTNLGDLGLPDRLARLCDQHGVPCEAITLELTETASAQDTVRILDTLTRFRIKGFKLSIDDFGTGFSSLAQLRKLPFSELKIDKSFVMSMARSRDSATIATAVINLAHNLGMEAVAEGVDSREALDTLKALGCDLAQGYYICKPRPSDSIPEFLRRRADARASSGG
jgi:EAL domain-containing protein (putative c-di-GMP-specific phosphodiesterase class I)/ActR/RegA family two-component response regulator